MKRIIIRKKLLSKLSKIPPLAVLCCCLVYNHGYQKQRRGRFWNLWLFVFRERHSIISTIIWTEIISIELRIGSDTLNPFISIPLNVFQTSENTTLSCWQLKESANSLITICLGQILYFNRFIEI